MALSIKETTVSGVTVLAPTGKVTIGQGDIVLREAVRQALEAGKRNILLNLGGVTTIDSSGIGELVSSYTAVSSRGGKLKLSNLPPKIQDMLMITQLMTVFDIYDTEAEAVKSFS